jgi:hypothetical protein
MEGVVMKSASENLSKLSDRARRAEDNVEAARKEAREKLAARREKARAEVAATMDKVDTDLQQARDSASTQWGEFKAKVQADRKRMKAKREDHKHERDVRRAENWAEDLELEAALSVDYAIASIEQAELAVLDALAARSDAEEAKVEPTSSPQ